MRLLLTGILALLWCGSGYAGDFEIDLSRIMAIESSGIASAYNAKSGASGLYQITPICLKDFNQYHKDGYVMADMFDPQKSARVAHWYMNTRIPKLLKAYGVPDGVEARLWAYNAGIRLVIGKIMPSETRSYIGKYYKMEVRA